MLNQPEKLVLLGIYFSKQCSFGSSGVKGTLVEEALSGAKSGKKIIELES